MHPLRTLVLSIAALLALLAPRAAQAAAPDPARMTEGELIDALREIDRMAVGLHATAWVSSFLAEEGPAEFGGGVLGSVAPAEFPQMRELVRRGARALPALLRHLDDARATRLVVGTNISPVMWARFAAEYDPRRREAADPAARAGEVHTVDFAELPYTVTVGDVCFVLIGQITNRNLRAVRYQPSGGMVIVSPVRDPALAGRVRSDWQGVTAEELKASLLRDARDLPEREGALVRLRVFYPEEYRQQRAGELKARIEALEAREKKG